MSVYTFFSRIKNGCHKYLIEPFIRKAFAKCGKNVRVPRACNFSGIKNIYVGSNVFFGARMTVLCTRARLMVQDNVMFGPNVTIITGDHRIDIPNKPMVFVSDEEKLPENDQDVIIEEDVWIGANVVILKGVKIAKGSVVAAGAIVTKDVPPYTIVGGCPAKVIKHRFEEKL